MLPKGWKNLFLDHVAQRKSGHTPDKKKPSYWNGGVKWVSLADSCRLDRGLIHNTDKEITEEGIKHSSAVLLPAGTVVLSRDAGVGKSAVLATPMAVSQHFIAWNCSESEALHNWYLYYWLQASKPKFERVANGSAIKTIGLPFFRKLKMQAPHMVEQRHIAEMLAAWGQVIATTERLLTNSYKQKQALMRELLSQCIDQGGSHACRLGDLFAERVEAARADLPLLSITRDEGVILRSDVGRKDTSNDDKSKYLRICKGDIGYNTMRMWQGVSALSSLEGIVSPAYTVLVPNEKVDAKFAAYLFKLDSMVFQFYRHSQGMVSDTWSLKFKHFAQIKVTIPSRKEQKRIVEVLAASGRTIEALKGELGHLQREKEGLMQQLLTGKRRVRLSKAAEAARS
jgi:type I restriction enzyme S subunit